MDENSDSRSSGGSNDVAVIESPIANGMMDMDHISDEDNGHPCIEITEQPQQRGFRFRYECEGPSHGGLQGANSERNRKTVPTIKIRNYTGPAKVVVSLVTDESVPKAHAHKLVGKNCIDGVCQVDVKAGTPQIQFPSLCIQHVTRRKATDVLEARIKDEMIMNKKRQSRNWNMAYKLTDEEKKKAKQEAQNLGKGMQLNVVRLCFQCYLVDKDQNIVQALNSVISDPIYDSKAPGANALRICRMDKYSGCCTGNDEVFLLCEKVQKDDIQVRFVEEDKDGNPIWQAYGHFGPFDVHRQFAIVFKTPEYHDVNIQSPVNVFVKLQRKSDGECSDPKSFTYYPRIRDIEDIDRKRRKLLPSYPNNFGSSNSSFGGNGNSNGSSGGGSSSGGDSHGLQNGGGSIPDFNNLQRTAQFGQRPLPLMSSVDSRRPILHAKRTQPAFQPQQQAPPLYTEAPVDIMSNPSQFVYEEISMNPPCNVEQLQNAVVSSQYYNEPSPQMMGVTSPSNSSISAASPYSSSMTIGSPQNAGHTHNSVGQFGALSPQCHTSPQQGISVQQMMDLPPQGHNIPMADNPMQANLQMSLSDLKLEHDLQPVQVSEHVDTDYMWNNHINTDLFDQFNQNNNQLVDSKNFMFGMKSVEQQLGQFQQVYGAQSCAYQARSPGRSCDHDLQDVIEVLDMVDGAPPRSDPCDVFDEVADLIPRSSSSSSVKQTAMLEPTLGKAVPVSEQKMHNPLPQTTSTSLIRDKILRTTDVSTSTNDETTTLRTSTVTLETSVQVEPSQTTETGVQTDMDPMMRLAMKTSEALQVYAASGDIRSLLMVQRFLMEVHNIDGDLPLHTALINQQYIVFQNILDVMVTLPDAYNRINAYNFHHQTPLHLAVITNQPDCVDVLIRAGADTTLIDRNGYTPAHLAVLYGHTKCLENLVKYVRVGVSAKQPFPELNYRCYDGFTPAHLAAQLENLAAMKVLVYGKADVNLPDGKSGRTPLHHAVEVDDLSLAAYLILQAGANVNEKRFDGNTALHVACGRGHVAMVALLMAGGADPNAENDDVISEDDVSSEDIVEDDGIDNDVDDENDDEPRTISTDDVDVKDADTEKEQKPETAIEPSDDDDNDDTQIKSSPARRGLRPADFAESDSKILKILNGEPYSSISSTFSDNLQQTTDKLASMRFVSHDSGRGSSIGTNGDMCKVEYPMRVDLSNMLDNPQTGSDCYTLAEKLGLRQFKTVGKIDTSPTRFLLTLYEESGGTISKLVQALSSMKRMDCVNLLNPLIDPTSEQLDDKKVSPKDPRFDSGILNSESSSQSIRGRNSLT